MTRAGLVHGWNVGDQGQGTTGGLRPHLERAGYQVFEYNTGWRFLSGIRFGHERRAKRLARMIQPGDLLIGHSDGCNIINRACWHLAASGEHKPAAVVYLNPALDRDTQLAPQVQGALVFHTRSDNVLWLAQKLPLHPWGGMGRYGYRENNPTYQDSRYNNIAYEHLAIDAPGHSGAFKKPEYLLRIHNYIRLFTQSLKSVRSD